jgi:glycosyltransferase involved in cell wall biosynthesis
VLIAALPLLGDAVVAVAGDGPLAAQLRAAAPQVRWLGRRTDVADLYAAADVVALPSVWEARSLTAQEALRAGVPLVATAVGGLPDLLGDGAVLVPPGDPVALGTAVRRLLDDPAAAAEVAARGRAVAAGWPDEHDAVAQVAALYAELLG